jgi:hypothetical protein
VCWYELQARLEVLVAHSSSDVHDVTPDSSELYKETGIPRKNTSLEC